MTQVSESGLLCLIAPWVNRPTSFTKVWDPWRPLEGRSGARCMCWPSVKCHHFTVGTLEAIQGSHWCPVAENYQMLILRLGIIESLGLSLKGIIKGRTIFQVYFFFLTYRKQTTSERYKFLAEWISIEAESEKRLTGKTIKKVPDLNGARFVSWWFCQLSIMWFSKPSI